MSDRQRKKKPVLTPERNLDVYVTHALHALLAGREPDEDDIVLLTGSARMCIGVLTRSLRDYGLGGVYKAFTALLKDQAWLGSLVDQSSFGGAELLPMDTDQAWSGPSLVDQMSGGGAELLPMSEELMPMSMGLVPMMSMELVPASTRRIRFLPDSVFENREPQKWLIPTILPKEGIALVFGPPGCGKSFLAMAWSLSVATGRDWLGRAVIQGPVAYIAGEGSFGIGPRIKTWKLHHGFTGESGVRWFDESIMLQEMDDVNELIRAFNEDFSEPPVLVVIDTLSRCSGGADENSNTEMARVLAAATLLQRQFHCTVLIVHHSGKDKDKGPRGASALTGNTETIIAIDPTDDGCKVSCPKQKEARTFDPFHLKLLQVQYGPHEDETSAVLTFATTGAAPKAPRSEQIMYEALADKELSYGDWTLAGMEYARKIEERLGERNAQNAIKKLSDTGKVKRVINGRETLYSIISEEQEDELGY